MGLVRSRITHVAEPPPDRATLEARVGSEDENVRFAAVRALAAFSEAGASLAAALATETSHAVREAIVTSLVVIGNPEAARGLAAHLGSEDVPLRNLAASGLAQMPDVARAELARLFASDDADVRIFAAVVAAGLGATAVDVLVERLEQETHVNALAAVIEALGTIADMRAVAPLRACAARTDDDYLRFAASMSLERCGAPS